MSGFEIKSLTEDNTCSVDVHHIAGCFACLTGFQISLTCTSDISDSWAHIVCENEFQWSTRSSVDGISSDHRVHVNKQQFATLCTVNCGGSKDTQFRYDGTLTEHNRLGHVSNRISGILENGQSVWDMNFMSILFGTHNWIYWLIMIIIISVILMFICPLLIHLVQICQVCTNICINPLRRN